MEQVNYEKLLPTEPPKDIAGWLLQLGAWERQYMTYRVEYVMEPLAEIKMKMVKCVCSECESEFYAEYVKPYIDCHQGYYASAPFGFINPGTYEEVISGKTTKCPYCETEVIAKHIGEIHGTYNAGEEYPITIERVGDRIALIAWRIVRVLHKDGRISFENYPYEAYVCEDRKIVRLVGYESGFYGTRVNGSRWHQRKRFDDTFGEKRASRIYPWDAKLLEGTSMENSKLDMYLKSDEIVCPISYCNLYLKHKNVENLIMQDMSRIINEKLKKLNSYYKRGLRSINRIENIDWKAKKPNKMLGLTKEEFKFAKRRKWKCADIEFYNVVKEAGVRPEDVKLCDKYGYTNVIQFAKDYPTENLMKVLRYLEKQRSRYPKQRKPLLGDLIDYWGMCIQLGEDIYSDDVCYPQNLIRMHARAADEYKAKEDEKTRRKYKERYKFLSQYDYMADGMFIRPAKSAAELNAEGENLHHCVASYANKHAEGKTAIFFIRHVEEPDISYFTLELDEETKTVKQNRGMRNCERTDEVRIFEEKWLEYIKNLEVEENGKRINKTRRTAKAAA